ncbi:UDP-3-O-(3-hydroxymyristoyl)glucosamine N-acyltransferase [Mariprofundus erugo]|nr:UDP-3-O-(3-hydroxymyristoyl)glucosamine N-acyltransferase [Mariprofundus erugo]
MHGSTANGLTVAEVATITGGVIEGEQAASARVVTGINTLMDASGEEIAFLSNQRYKKELATTRAAAVLLAHKMPADCDCCVIRVKDPYLAFAQLQRHFHPAAQASGQRHASAVIADDAVLAPDVEVGAGAVIGAGTTIAAGTIIGAGVVIGSQVVIGSFCRLHANSVVMDRCILGHAVILQPGVIIGSDGFGYAWSGDRHLKIPQVGRVILEDDVEIGANTCIDRGAIGDTVIERGVKLDNLVQIAHNVRVGAYTVMASQVGVSGSSHVGKGCQLGGQVGVAGHLHIGDGCRLAGQTGVMSDLEAKGTYAGSPAMPHRLWLKVSAIMLKLPDIWKALHPR